MMRLFRGIKKVFGGAPAEAAASSPAAAEPPAPEPEEIRVPEVAATDLMTELAGSGSDRLLLLDCREPYERARSFIPNSLHIPMNSIPHRLEELQPDADIVVYCAHGHRSYGVAGWLIQQGYTARSLKDGIVGWQLQRGPLENGYRAAS